MLRHILDHARARKLERVLLERPEARTATAGRNCVEANRTGEAIRILFVPVVKRLAPLSTDLVTSQVKDRGT
jgi:hypothetical protein